MEALLEAVCEMRRREPAAKAICFSQFVNALDLIEYRLLKANESGGELNIRLGLRHCFAARRSTVMFHFCQLLLI